MTILPPKDKLPLANPQAAGSAPAETAPSDPSSVKARGLADFVEGLISGSRLRRAGLPTKPELPEPSQEQAEEEPPELLDLLLEGPDAVVVLHREQGEVIEVSERFLEWSGLTREQLAGKSFLDFFHEPERKIARTLYEDAGAGGVHVLELPCAAPGMRPRLVEFTAAQSKAGGHEADDHGRTAVQEAGFTTGLRSLARARLIPVIVAPESSSSSLHRMLGTLWAALGGHAAIDEVAQRAARREERGQLEKPGAQVHEPDAGDSAADEVAADERPKRGITVGEIVVIPRR